VPRPRTPKGRAREAAARLAVEYPGDAQDLCALDFATPFQLLVATVLSAQTTDERVNMVTPSVFARYPTPAELGNADPDELENLIRSTGFFRSKARSLIGLGRALDERFAGEVPRTMEELVTVPGVGRKTANVVRSVGFGLPGFPVDTHVARLTRLLGLTISTDPDRIERDVDALLPAREWGPFSLRLILHGRRVCVARRPRCEDCLLADFCPSAFLVGRATSAPALAPAPAGPSRAPGASGAPEPPISRGRRSNRRSG
jgi:endonuclease III